MIKGSGSFVPIDPDIAIVGSVCGSQVWVEFSSRPRQPQNHSDAALNRLATSGSFHC